MVGRGGSVDVVRAFTGDVVVVEDEVNDVVGGLFMMLMAALVLAALVLAWVVVWVVLTATAAVLLETLLVLFDTTPFIWAGVDAGAVAGVVAAAEVVVEGEASASSSLVEAGQEGPPCD